MPTYINDSTSVLVTVDGCVFRPGQTRVINHYLNDSENKLTLLSDTPFYNPVILDQGYSGSNDSTTEITISLTADFIYLDATGNVEIFRNSIDNTPSLKVSAASKIIKISNRDNTISKLILKFIDASATNIQVTVTTNEI